MVFREDDPFHMRELLYPSNMVTLARLLLLPPTISYLRQPGRRAEALFCMATSMLTDVIDGPLARRRGEVSQLGKLLDPIADKLVLDTIAITLSQKGTLPWWITSLILTRDAGIALAALLLYHHHTHIMPSMIAGKTTTVALTTAIFLYIADGERSGKPAMYVALALAVLSVLQYGRRFIKLMNQQTHNPTVRE